MRYVCKHELRNLYSRGVFVAELFFHEWVRCGHRVDMLPYRNHCHGDRGKFEFQSLEVCRVGDA